MQVVKLINYGGSGSIESIGTFQEGIVTFEPIGLYVNGGIGIAKPNRTVVREDIDYMMYFSAYSRLHIYEKGVAVYSSSNNFYVAGDQFSIELKNGEVTYWKIHNEERFLLYTSTKAANGDYAIDSFLHTYYDTNNPLQNITYQEVLKESFEVKVIDPLYYFNLESTDYKKVGKNLIKDDGSKTNL